MRQKSDNMTDLQVNPQPPGHNIKPKSACHVLEKCINSKLLFKDKQVQDNFKKNLYMVFFYWHFLKTLKFQVILTRGLQPVALLSLHCSPMALEKKKGSLGSFDLSKIL